jgi:hypothetical protein
LAECEECGWKEFYRSVLHCNKRNHFASKNQVVRGKNPPFVHVGRVAVLLEFTGIIMRLTKNVCFELVWIWFNSIQVSFPVEIFWFWTRLDERL